MAIVHLTLTDTPSGGVSLYSDFKPRVGNPCTPAQGAALEILARTGKQWGVEPTQLPTPTTCRCFVQAVEERERAKPAKACKHHITIKKPGALHYTCVECGEVAAAA